MAIATLLLRYRPANLKLVFSGRYLPFARGSIGLLPDITWLTTRDLSFSIAEFNALLERQQLTLPSAEVPSLLRKMQGWPAGLALWLMAWPSTSTMVSPTWRVPSKVEPYNPPKAMEEMDFNEIG